MAILDADPQETPQERLLKLEAENLVARELIRALIAKTKPDPIGDAPFTVAVQTINATARTAQPDYQQAIALTLKNLDPYSVARSRS